MTLTDLIPPILLTLIGILLVAIGPANPHRQSKPQSRRQDAAETRFDRKKIWPARCLVVYTRKIQTQKAGNVALPMRLRKLR